MTRKKPKSEKPGEAWRAYQPRNRTPHDYEVAACVLDVTPPDLEQRRDARQIVAGNSKDADEAKELMLMLGIYPEPGECPPKRKRKVTQK